MRMLTVARDELEVTLTIECDDEKAARDLSAALAIAVANGEMRLTFSDQEGVLYVEEGVPMGARQ